MTTVDVNLEYVDSEAPGEPHTSTWWDLVGNGISSVTLWITGALLAATIVVVIIEIIYRYWLREPFLSSSDLLVFSFTWISFLSLPRAVWFGRSPRLGIIRYGSGLLGRTAINVEIGTSLGYFVMMFISYIKLEPSQSVTKIQSLGVPDWIEGVAVLVGSSLMAMVLLIRHRRELRGIPLLGFLVGFIGIMAVVRYVNHPEEFALVILAVLLLLNAPIAVALGLTGFILVTGGNWLEFSVPAQQLLQPMQNLALLALPLFLLMGGIVGATRLSDNLALLIRRLVGWLPGGTAIANTVTAALFANISGSAIADTAAIGEIYIPQLKRLGYPAEEAAAVSASAGVIGVVFPPAVAMILFASAAQISVIPVFKAVIIPGIMILVMMGFISYLRGRRIVDTRTGIEPFSVRLLLRALPAAVPVLLIPVILDGGILSGVFTPPESGAVAVVVTLFMILIFHSSNLKGIWNATKAAVDSTATVMFIITAVSIIDYGFVVSGVGNQISSLLNHFTGNHLLLLLIINLVFMVVHEFVDAGPTILVLVPLILFSVAAAHINIYQLAAIIAINSTIGSVLPPVGMGVYVASSIANVDSRKVFRITWIYALGSLVVLVIVVLVPQVSLWLTTAI